MISIDELTPRILGRTTDELDMLAAAHDIQHLRPQMRYRSDELWVWHNQPSFAPHYLWVPRIEQLLSLFTDLDCFVIDEFAAFTHSADEFFSHGERFTTTYYQFILAFVMCKLFGKHWNREAKEWETRVDPYSRHAETPAPFVLDDSDSYINKVRK